MGYGLFQWENINWKPFPPSFHDSFKVKFEESKGQYQKKNLNGMQHQPNNYYFDSYHHGLFINTKPNKCIATVPLVGIHPQDR